MDFLRHLPDEHITTSHALDHLQTDDGWLKEYMPDGHPEMWLGVLAMVALLLIVCFCHRRRRRRHPVDVDDQFYSLDSDGEWDDMYQIWWFHAAEGDQQRRSSIDAGITINGRFNGYADDEPVNLLEGKTMPNFSPEQRTGSRPPMGSHFPCSWSPASAPELRVRVGPDYLRHGKKAPSGTSLYECVGADYVKAERRIDRVVPGGCRVIEGGPSNWHTGLRLPRAIVINCQIPYEPGPTMWGVHPVEDGGMSVVPQFLVSEETCRVAELTKDLAPGDTSLSQQEPSANAVRLLQRFCDNDGAMRIDSGNRTSGVVKVIGWVEDINALSLPAGLGSVVHKYNGKPVLLSHAAVCRFAPDKDWLELEFDVRKFTFIARNMMSKLRYKLRECSCHVAFVLQGTEDSELPEVVLCNLRLHNLAVDFPYTVDGPPAP